jgi:hypothetical protein
MFSLFRFLPQGISLMQSPIKEALRTHIHQGQEPLESTCAG